MTDITLTSPDTAAPSGSFTTPVLAVNDLSVSFHGRSGRNLALKGVSFTVNKGEIVAVVGESGSGKSVTSLAVMGLLANSATIERGGVQFTGRDGKTRDLLSLNNEQRRQLRGRDMAMIFQEPMTSLNPVLKVGDQLTEALRDHQLCDKQAADVKARELLRKVRIADVDRVMKSYPHSLSGGMRQRVMIAQALACDPQLLIADEPTTALDVTVQARILQILRDLQQQTNMAVMFITHDMGVVAEVADRVVVMYRGEVVEQGSVEQIFTAPQHAYTQSLLAAVPRLGDMRDSRWPKRFPLLGQQSDNAGDQQITARYEEKPLLDVRGLRVYYPVRSGVFSALTHRVHAVEQIDFSLWPGETLAIVGESGCGKSTTGRALLRLIDSQAESILFRGDEISHLKEQAFQPLRREMQMVFQDPYASLNPRLTVGFTIAEPLLLHGLVKSLEEATPQVQELLKSVGLLPEHASRYPHEFSGGQRQRIAIARAMSLQPQVIIADEAVSALDVSIQAQVVNLMMDLQKSTGVAWIFISHDMAVVERIANRVAVMYLGQIVEIGPRQSVFNHPQHPYTRRLLSSVPVADPLNRALRTFDDSEIPSPLRKVGTEVEKTRYRQVAEQHWVAEGAFSQA
ncbi:ABC transporter ATP-binding protein [Erwiniaceae bacterium BAC15a-03b]|uniref:Glutathione import ATP-binding protein GsiA n=1 Tax=Winslowiella arboricola TaxID=2978220 RepID=A0A9J6PQ78_9GAMM|nr:ABC transporter ATP-binding protein [Winslowiella arboricola]MCU5774183.1 ABC transporter ATP-binding protein [Winslowiella arboricola]MCU5776884.1 ABC transporter ATP-binding protein [Winslowiella arboricola]